MLTLGDSISQAEVGFASWRYWLWRTLRDENLSFTWVGSMTTMYDRNAGAAPASLMHNGQSMPQHHEGHWGWTADEVLARLTVWAAAYPCQPTCALVHLGTNDACNLQTGTVSEILQLEDTLRASSSPSLVVLLAVPIPSCCDAVNASLNPAIRALGETAARFLVHHDVGFDPSTMLYDGCHPSELGEMFMAARWMEAIRQHCIPLQPLISPSPPSPPVSPPPSLPSTLNAFSALAITLGLALPALLLLVVVAVCMHRHRRLRQRTEHTHMPATTSSCYVSGRGD